MAFFSIKDLSGFLVTQNRQINLRQGFLLLVVAVFGQTDRI